MNGRDTDQGSPDTLAGLSKSRELFEHSVERMDVGTGNRLRLMRRDALNGPQPRTLRWLLPAAGMASALVLAGLAFWQPVPTEQTAVTPPEYIDAGETIFAGEDDAEMYAWLGEAPVAVDPTQEKAL